MNATATADLIINARYVVPVEPAGQVLEHHSVVVKDGRILDLLPTGDAQQRYVAPTRVDLDTHALIPGLVNLHTHAAMSLMRGLADDLPLMEWLNDHIWPAEAKHVSNEFVYDGTLLACAEMIRGGITCFNDMYFFPEQTARAALAAGMRAAIGLICIEFPTAYASDAQDYLRKGLAVRDEFKSRDALSFCMAPHAPYTVSDRSFEQIIIYAEELQTPVHVHLHETLDEIRESQTRFGMRPIERLRRLGLLSPGLIAVHAVHLLPEEIAVLRETGSHVAHCPSSNLKLASGIAPVAALDRSWRERRRGNGRRRKQQPAGPVRGNAHRCPARQGRFRTPDLGTRGAGARHGDTGTRPRPRTRCADRLHRPGQGRRSHRGELGRSGTVSLLSSDLASGLCRRSRACYPRLAGGQPSAGQSTPDHVGSKRTQRQSHLLAKENHVPSMTQELNVDPLELEKFSKLAHRWWDPNSEFKPLHQINPLRLKWINDRAGLAGQARIGCRLRRRNICPRAWPGSART